MTCTESLGKFSAKIKHRCGALGIVREREIEFNVDWVSCGVYQMEYYRPRGDDIKPHYVIVEEDWYPPDTFCCFTPEQFEKVAELYPTAPKLPREQCYKPFYEDYELDRGMMDFGHDRLFQAYKDPCEEMVYLVNRYFVFGMPEEATNVLGLEWSDFLRLSELLISNKHLIFYSGVKFGPQGVEKVWVTDQKPDHVK